MSAIDPTLLPPGPVLDQRAQAAPRRGARARYVYRRLLRRPLFLIGVTITAFWALSALFWPLVAPHDPLAINPLATLQPPSGAHWFGTDDLGRDVFSRVLAGARSVFAIAPAATLLGVALGTATGLVAGYYRGLLDDIIMRVVEALLTLPSIIVAIFAISVLGSARVNVVLVIAVLFAPLIARTVRSAVLTERDRGYVEAARLRGESGPHIMFVEILPNITAPIVVELVVRFGYAVFTAATLSFLGLGVQPPSPDWGLIVASERGFVQVAPWTVVFPALALASLIVAINLVDDELRKALDE